jgi:hypothetical protein
MFWRRGYTLRGEVGGGWALEFPSFLGPVKWHRADRRVPFGVKKVEAPLKMSREMAHKVILPPQKKLYQKVS